MVHTPIMLSIHIIQTSTCDQNKGLYTSIIHIQNIRIRMRTPKPQVLQPEHRLDKQK